MKKFALSPFTPNKQILTLRKNVRCQKCGIGRGVLESWQKYCKKCSKHNRMVNYIPIVH